MMRDTLEQQVQDATIAEFDTGPTGISGFYVDVEENPDATVTGTIRKGSNYNDQGTPPGDPLPFSATFQKSQFEDIPTQQFGEDDEITAPDYNEIDPLESDSTSRLANLVNVPVAPGSVTRATDTTVTDVLAELADGVSDDRTFSTNAPGNSEAGVSVSLYETGDKKDLIGNVLFENVGESTTVFSALDDVSGEDVRRLDNSDIVTGTEGGEFSESVVEASAERKQRRSIREAAREQIEADPDTSLDDVSIDARAGDDPSIVFQDPDTGQTERVELEDTSESGIESAVESIDTSSEQESANNDSTSSPASRADGLGQVGGIVLVAAIGTAVYYGVTQL